MVDLVQDEKLKVTEEVSAATRATREGEGNKSHTEIGGYKASE